MIKSYLQDFKPYPPGKPISELKRELGISGPIIKLASNENPFGPPPRAIRAIKEAISDLHRYPDPAAYNLRKALASHYKVEPEEIVLGNGSNEILDLLVKACLSPKEEALMSEPSFLMYEKFVTAAGGKAIKVPLKNFQHDLQGLARKITEKTKIIFLDNPHNPTGSIIYHEEFEAWYKALPKELVIVIDEAYGEFVDDPKVLKPLFFKNFSPPVVLLRTFSKAYGLAGLRVGYGIMQKKLARILNAIRQPFNVNSLAQVAAQAALEDRNFLQKVLETTRTERKRLTEALKALGLHPYPSQANFIFVDLHQPARKIYEALLKKGVIVRSMEAYGFPSFLRISIGTPEENTFFLSRLEEVLHET